MPVISVAPVSAPAVPRASLEDAQTRAKQAVAEFKQQARQERQGVKAALTEVRTAFAEMGKYVNSARNRAGHSNAREALARDLRGIRNLDANAPLRLKDEGLKSERIKSRESSSVWKRCVGYGKATRSGQVQALATRHGIDLAAHGGKVTRNGLWIAQLQAADNDVIIAQSAFDRKSATLGSALGKAVSLLKAPDASITAPGGEGARTADIPSTDSLLTRLRTGVAADVRASAGEVPLADARSLFKTPLMDAFNKRIDDARASLDDNVARANEALRRFDRQTRIDERAPALVGLVKADPIERERHTVLLAAELNKLQDEWAFGTVFGTNMGCRAVQNMCRDTEYELDGASIKNEIEERKGPETFLRGEKSAAYQLTSYANSLDSSTVNAIARVQRQIGLNHFADGDFPQTSYRQATHTPAMLNTLHEMVRTGQLLRPEQFLSTATRVEDTRAYPLIPTVGSSALIEFRIKGFSGMPLASRYPFAGERWERVYTHLSTFKVVSVEEQHHAHVVTLLEVPASAAQLKAATLLTR
ncbi:hypothetical protein [Stenotrophomonas sp.]|uniref:hypothetical protein n=1 Tax=Stenotrophomonas sp. TaxID=69392 RepID=UPI002FCBE092